jgi:hypothetical protein
MLLYTSWTSHRVHKPLLPSDTGWLYFGRLTGLTGVRRSVGRVRRFAERGRALQSYLF